MQSNIEEISNVKRKITLNFENSETVDIYEETIEHCRAKSTVKGFRAGKAPKSIIIQQFGDLINSTIVDKLISPRLFEELEKANIQPISVPIIDEFNYIEGQPLTCVIHFELKPTFNLPELSGLKLETYKQEIKDDLIDRRIETIRSNLATTKTAEEGHEVEKDDLVNISYELFHKGKPVVFKKTDKKNLTVVACSNSGKVLPEIEDGLLGLKKGETRDITLTLPDTVTEKGLSGQEVTFNITVNEIMFKEIPEINDDLAKDIGLDDVDNLQALREYIRNELVEALEGETNKHLEYQVSKKISSSVDFELPESMLKKEIDLLITSNQQYIERSLGRKLDAELLQDPELRKGFVEEATDNLRTYLVLTKLSEEQNLEVTEEDIQSEMDKIAKQTGQSADIIKKTYEKNKWMDNLKYQLTVQKALKYIISKAEIAEIEPPKPSDHSEPDESESDSQTASDSTVQAD